MANPGARGIAIVTLLVTVAGCLHDHGESSATLDNVWPNEDGSRWTYELTRRNWFPAGGSFPDSASVPPAPTLDEIVALLGSHPIGTVGARTETGEYRFGFDGMITTGTGVTAQRVVTEYESASPGVRAAERVSPFTRHLWVARPDLREKMLAAGFLREPLRGGPQIVVSPLFLNGYAWAKTSEWIGGYGEFDAELARIYLEADLEPGHEFSMQLAAAVTDDVFLHARILPRHSLETPAGTFHDVVECVYLVDFGVSAVMDEFGSVLGYFGVYAYGTVSYAPNVGPIASYERDFVSKSNPPDPDPGAGDYTIVLTKREVDRW